MTPRIFARLLAILLSLPAYATTYYVSVGGNDNNNGTTNTPWRTIQYAIGQATDGDEIVVYPGLYCENIDFQFKSLRVHSSLEAERTVIHGDVSASVVRMEDISGPASLEGFTISGGGGTQHDFGASGIYLAGGGVLVYRCDGGIQLSDLKVRDNTAMVGGGIMVFATPTIVIERCQVYQNLASDTGGGIGYVSHAPYEVILRNSVICQNNAAIDGGGILVDYSTKLILQHVTMAENMAPIGSIMRRANAGAFFAANCIFDGAGGDDFYWEGGADFASSLDHCCVPNTANPYNVSMLAGNIYTSPNYRPHYDRFQLDANSPCRNAGVAIAGLGIDLLGWPRSIGAAPDMGAYEVLNCADPQLSPAEEPVSPDVLLLPQILGANPNPFKSTVYVSISLPKGIVRGKLYLSDQLGRMLREQPVDGGGTQTLQLDTEGLQPGAYFLSLSTEGFVHSKVLIKIAG